jgi:LysR family transcriptional regulator for bpeEF and oprC
LDDGEAMVAAVQAGLGVTQVPSYMAAAAVENGSAIEVLEGMRPKPDPITALFAAQQGARLGCRVFLDFLSTVPELQRASVGTGRAPEIDA